MTHEKLRRRLADNEDNYTGQKPEGVKLSELRKTVIAFANSVRPGRDAL